MGTVERTIATEDVLARFRARLVRLREDAGLTRRQLSNAVGIDISTVARLEHGERAPSLALAAALAQTFGVAVEELFVPDIEPADVAALERQRRDDAHRAWLHLMRRSGAETWPMRTTLAIGQGERCCFPFEPCTCRTWVAPVDTHERMDA